MQAAVTKTSPGLAICWKGISKGRRARRPETRNRMFCVFDADSFDANKYFVVDMVERSGEQPVLRLPSFRWFMSLFRPSKVLRLLRREDLELGSDCP
jgi:hypothetical protein